MTNTIIAEEFFDDVTNAGAALEMTPEIEGVTKGRPKVRVYSVDGKITLDLCVFMEIAGWVMRSTEDSDRGF